MLDMLNESRNALNIIVLDACRDFPAAWSRSLNRGLAIISNPPANHIIMFATGAGQVASDGMGRNGLFTTHLLNNIRQPNDVNEIFRRTMVDVATASNNMQRPALYTDFGRSLFFGQQLAQPVVHQVQQVFTPNAITTLPSFDNADGFVAPIQFGGDGWLLYNGTRFGTFSSEMRIAFMQYADANQFYLSSRRKSNWETFSYVFGIIFSSAIICIPMIHSVLNSPSGEINIPWGYIGIGLGSTIATGITSGLLKISSSNDLRMAIRLYNNNARNNR